MSSQLIQQAVAGTSASRVLCPNDLVVAGNETVNGSLTPAGGLNGLLSSGYGTTGVPATNQVLLPAPPSDLTIANEIAPVTKVWNVGLAATNITFPDLNAWINDIKPHKFFISIIAKAPYGASSILEFGSFDYFSFGSSVAGQPQTSAPTTVTFTGSTLLVTTLSPTASGPPLGSGPYTLRFNWGGSTIPATGNTLYIYIKVIM